MSEATFTGPAPACAACIPFPAGRRPRTERRLREPDIHGDEPLYVESLPRVSRQKALRERWAGMCKAFNVRIFLYPERSAEFRAKWGVCPYMRIVIGRGSWNISPDGGLTDEQIDAELARVFLRISQGRTMHDA